MKKSRIALILVMAGFIIVSAIVVKLFKPDWIYSDRNLMWHTTEIKSGRVSTPAAVDAAKRYFDQVNLIGMTRDEVVATIGSPKDSNDSMYNFPFYPIKDEVIVYRFDTGAYGWQFNIVFDDSGRVIEVKHLGIE